MPSYSETLALYHTLVSHFDHVQIKGKTMPYTSFNGNMYSFLDKEGNLCFRLGKEDKAQYNENHNPEPVIQYNSTMRGYVYITKEILAQKEDLLYWFKKAYDFVNTLPKK